MPIKKKCDLSQNMINNILAMLSLETATAADLKSIVLALVE